MAIVVKWNGRAFEQKLRESTATGLNRATTFLHAECRREVSKPNSGVRVPVKRKAKGGNKKSRTIYPNPSKPGEPPKLRTGFGQRNVVKEFDAPSMRGRVGVTKNGLYMFFLDIGTKNIERRPWLMATLMKHSATIGKLAATGGK
jgi:hypothetical protein